MSTLDKLLWPFWNEEQRRIRTLWRIIAFGLLLLFFNTLLGLLAWSVLLRETLVVMQTISVLATLFSMLVAARVLDRRPFVDFGFHLGPAWWRDFGMGFVLGALLMTGIFLLEWAAGWLTVERLFVAPPGRPFIVALLAAVWLFIAVAINEEGIARGYLLLNLAEGLRLPILGPRGAVYLAWLLSSLFFGLMHMFNPNVTFLSIVNLCVAGLFLGFAYIRTSELALPIGLHFSWNFFQGNVYGFPVSGLDAVRNTTVILVRMHGPPLWTGGPFGPEGGLVGLGAIVIGSVLVWWWTRERQCLFG